MLYKRKKIPDGAIEVLENKIGVHLTEKDNGSKLYMKDGVLYICIPEDESIEVNFLRGETYGKPVKLSGIFSIQDFYNYYFTFYKKTFKGV